MARNWNSYSAEALAGGRCGHKTLFAVDTKPISASTMRIPGFLTLAPAVCGIRVGLRSVARGTSLMTGRNATGSTRHPILAKWLAKTIGRRHPVIREWNVKPANQAPQISLLASGCHVCTPIEMKRNVHIEHGFRAEGSLHQHNRNASPGRRRAALEPGVAGIRLLSRPAGRRVWRSTLMVART